MPNKKKMIQINPDFFKMGKKTKNKRGTKQKPDFRQTIKPNNIKKQLLAKIKAHQQKEKQLQNQQCESAVEKFSDDFNSSLNYLDAMIKEKQQKKHKKTRKKNKFTNKHTMNSLGKSTNHCNNLNSSQNTPAAISNYSPSPQIHTEPFVKNNATGNFINTINKNQKPSLVQFNNTNTTINSGENIAPDPPYGCLKNGKKPTYNQYMKTLKRQKPNRVPIKSTLLIHDNPLTKNPSSNEVLERKEKLKQLKAKIAEPKRVKPTKTIKVKKTIKIFKLGKKNGKVGVLVKSAKTRKIVRAEHKYLHNKCMSDVKRYLRKHNLIKAGTSAPESVLRGIYENSFLAGEIYNKNPDLLYHNYVNDED